MNENTVTQDQWSATADELRRIADDLETLVGQPAPRYVGLDIQPYNGADPGGVGGDAATIAAVNAVALALLGHEAQSKRVGGSSWHHTASGHRGRIQVGAFQSISDPDALARDAELERLRAEVAELRASRKSFHDTAPDAVGLDYSREADDPTPISPARGGQPRTGAMTDEGLIEVKS